MTGISKEFQRRTKARNPGGNMRNREIETKMITDKCSLDTVNLLLKHWLQMAGPKMSFGSSNDTYWDVPAKVPSFLRVREMGPTTIMTLKQEDMGGYQNRLEIDLLCSSKLEDILQYNTSLYGAPIGTIFKTYYTYSTPHAHIGAYTIQVNGVDIPLTFVEVEGHELDIINYYASHLKETVPGLREVNKSLKSLYLDGGII